MAGGARPPPAPVRVHAGERAPAGTGPVPRGRATRP